MSSHNGKQFLFSRKDKFNGGKLKSDGSIEYNDSNGNKGKVFSDGSGYFSGNDGSKGKLYSDGSGYWKEPDGSKGEIFSSGKGYWEDNDGNREEHSKGENDGDFGLAEMGLLAGGIFLLNSLCKKKKESSNSYDYEEDDDDDCNDDDDYEEYESNSDLSNSRNVNVLNDNNESYYTNSNNRQTHIKENNDKSVIFLMIFILIIFGSLFYFLYREITPNENEIKLIVNPQDYVDTYYKDAEERFIEMGFDDVKSIPKKDLINGWINKKDTIDEITIDANSEYTKGDIVPKDAKVRIIYHSFKK